MIVFFISIIELIKKQILGNYETTLDCYKKPARVFFFLVFFFSSTSGSLEHRWGAEVGNHPWFSELVVYFLHPIKTGVIFWVILCGLTQTIGFV